MPATLLLVRHGQSVWNQANLFTGWEDADLSELGRQEAAQAGRDLAEAGIAPTVVHTSLQTRAIRTAQIALDELGRLWLPVRRSWRLNERHYGALQGQDKKAAAAEHGLDQVKVWRRSYDVPPPALSPDDPRHPANDPRYAGLPPEVLPSSECLKDVLVRMLPWWQDAIAADLAAGEVVMVAAHGNSLRALVKHLDGIADDEISGVEIPTGRPIRYELGDDLRPLERKGLLDRIVGDVAAAKEAAEAVARQAG